VRIRCPCAISESLEEKKLLASIQSDNEIMYREQNIIAMLYR